MSAIDRAYEDLNGRTLADRFRVERLLARARGELSVLALDLEHDREVVIVAIPAIAATHALRGRLQREVQALGHSSGPVLAPLLYVGDADGLLFTVRPFVSGQSLAEMISDRPLRVEEALMLARDMMLGLQVIHDSGILHRALEPASVIVTPGDPHAVLTYSGLSRASQFSYAGDPVPEAGPYASPEEAGLLRRGLDERSDLYSGGAVLYECLYGRTPVDGTSVSDRPYSGVPPEIPAAVDALIQRLLRSEPAARYPSASAVAHEISRILAAAERGAEAEIGPDPREHAGTELREPAFIGRQSELHALRQKLAAARRGAGGLATLGGESGAGKTRLLDEFARSCTEEGAWVLRGGGRGIAAERPYQVLDDVVSAVAARVVTDEDFASRLRTRLRGYESAIVATMPRLAMAAGYDASNASTPEAYGEIRSRRALSVVLAALGTADRPALVLVDDCQWADELTLELLQRWPEHLAVSGAPVHVLIVAAYRTEDVASEHRLNSMSGASQIRLPMLAPEEMEALVTSMASDVPQQARDVVERVSGGSPFMAAEVLRGLVETGVLVAVERGWRVEPERMADAQSSERAARFLSGRFDQLSPSALELLSAGAVLGKQFELDPARELALQSLADARAALAEARSRHMVWFDADTGHWTFMHDKLREELLERLSMEERRHLHRNAALSLAVEHPDRVFELAYHFDEADEPERALPYALEAALSARSRYALEIADRYYRIAGRGVDPDDRATRLAVCEGLGDVAMLRGAYVEAGEQLAAAAEVCEDDFARAAIEGKLGELAFKRGDVDTSVARLHNGLRLLSQRVPRTRIGYLWALIVQVLVQAMHTLAPVRFLGRRALEGAERELLTVRLLSELAHTYWFRSGLVPCGWAHLREMNLAERYPTTPELAQAYSEHAPVMTMIPWFKRGIAYGRRSIEIRHELGDAWGEAQSRHFLGVVLYAGSRYEETLESCRLAVETLERTGDQWEVSTAKWHIAFSLYRLGRLHEAVEMSREVHRAAVALGDAQASGISLGAWSKAARGAIPTEPVRAALESLTSDVHTSAEVLQAEAIRQLAAGDPLAAVEALQRADRLVRHAGLRQEYVAPVTPWLATALRRAAADTPDASARDRRRLARRARRASRRARRLARFYRNNLPHALREQGLLAAGAGSPRRARRLLDKSMRVAEEQGASYEHAQSAVAMGELAAGQGWPGGEAMLEQARRTLDALTVERSSDAEEPTVAAL